MNKILDYEQMIEKLDSFKNALIKEEDHIGETTFGYPIRHYSYGNGPYHIIITAGTHATELISNIFVLKLMEDLANGNIIIDKDEYTIHFLPILNPEGTIIITSAIRSLIKRDTSDLDEQLFCVQYYMNSKLEDNLAIEKNDHDIKTQNWMFRYADANCIDYNHSDLRDSVDKIIKKHQLPKGVLISWNSNGNGIDLNANIECGEYIDKFIANEEMAGPLRQNTILKNLPGPIGCPSRKIPIEIEPENIAILNFYNKLIKEEKVIGSIIYHSCGGIVYYLDEMKENNPWIKNYGEKEIAFNKAIALKYGEISQYKVQCHKTFTTMDIKLKSYLPGTLLVELSKIRATPLSQFIDMTNSIYTETITNNLKAIKPTIEEMKKQYNLYQKK